MVGKYIAIEGPDGAGKTTQLKLLAKAFEQAQLKYITVREPGGTDVGKQLREILLTGHADKMDGVMEALLFSADRRHTAMTITKPSLEKGMFVLSDRTYLTTMVFQGYGRGLNRDILETLTQIAIDTIRPDLMVVLDVDEQTSLQRKGVQAQAGLQEIRFESMGESFHARNRKGYLSEAAKNSETYWVLDASQGMEAIHHSIVAEINQRFGLNLQAVI
ncbi:MAG: dTMP kinase [Alphaproteobacteria bacterium]|nr:dTMP kinase [Alphaproteobacteria bacterium]